jgi:hypothetical protein
MPFQPASTLEKTVRIKALLLGAPGVGKTTVAVCTMPRPVAVILCESDTALDYPRVSMRDDEGMSEKEIDRALIYQRASDWESMLKAIQEVRAEAEKGAIQTLVVDPLSFWCDRLMDQCFKWTLTSDGKEDGRRAHPELTRRTRQIAYQLLALPCHVVVVSHHIDVGDAAKRGGPDKVPMLPNKEVRGLIHGMFPHKLWMQFNPDGKRIFVTTPNGSTGPGVRGLKGSSEIPADFGDLMARLSIPGASETEFVAQRAVRADTNGAPKTNGAAGVTHVAQRPAGAKPQPKPQPPTTKTTPLPRTNTTPSKPNTNNIRR